MVIVALLGIVAIPAPVLAADPPDPTLSVANVHYASRGVIEVDVTYSCVAPRRGAEWYPYLAVGASQGHGRRLRYAYDEIGLTRATCNGLTQVTTFRLAPDETGAFRGGRASVWAELEASSESTDTYVDQYAWFEGRVRVSRH